MIHRLAGIVTLLAALLLAVPSAVGQAHTTGGRPQQDFPPRPGGTPVLVVGPPTTPPPEGPVGGQLSAPQQQSALRIALADRVVHHLLRRKSYHASRAAPWTGRKQQFLGAAVTFSFAHPATVKGPWLDLDYDCAEKASPPYGRVLYHAVYVNVTTIVVYVDLGRNLVAGTRPDGSLRGKARYPAHFRHRPACTAA